MLSHLHSSQIKRLEEQACADLEQMPDMPFDFACLGKLAWIESQKADAHPETGLGYQHCSTPRGLDQDLLFQGLHRPSVKDSPCLEGFAAELQGGMTEDSH